MTLCPTPTRRESTLLERAAGRRPRHTAVRAPFRVACAVYRVPDMRVGCHGDVCTEKLEHGVHVLASHFAPRHRKMRRHSGGSQRMRHVH